MRIMLEKNHSSTLAGPEKIINKACSFFLWLGVGVVVVICFIVYPV